MSRYLDLLKQADKLEVEWQKQVLELEAQSNPKPSTILAVNQNSITLKDQVKARIGVI
jgi:hypothetical protein